MEPRYRLPEPSPTPASPRPKVLLQLFVDPSCPPAEAWLKGLSELLSDPVGDPAEAPGDRPSLGLVLRMMALQPGQTAKKAPLEAFKALPRQIQVPDLEADALAERFGVHTSPTLFINGYKVEGPIPKPSLSALVAREMAVLRWGPDRPLLELDRAEPPPVPERHSGYRVPKGRSQGAKQPEVDIVMYGDYACPHSQRQDARLRAWIAKDPEGIRLSFKPWVTTEAGHMAAIWALMAEKAGRFWEAHAQLMKDPNARVPLSNGKFTEMDAQKRLNRIDMEAAQMGAVGTPSLLVNGRLLPGIHTEARFRALIHAERARTAALKRSDPKGYRRAILEGEAPAWEPELVEEEADLSAGAATSEAAPAPEPAVKETPR